MAEVIEAGTNNFPVHGGDATVTLASEGGALNWFIQSIKPVQDAKRWAVADLNGDTKARGWYDKDGEKKISMEVIMTGTTGGGDITANTLPVIGTTKYVIASLKYPSMNGTYTVDTAEPNITNAGPMAWTLTMNKSMA